MKVYTIVTPSGRSTISIKEDPVKALYKTKTQALKWKKIRQVHFNVKLRVKAVRISKKLYKELF